MIKVTVLWAVSWIDYYFLWRLPREWCYKYWFIQQLVLLTKWLLHLITGQSELRRRLSYEVSFGSTTRVNPTDRRKVNPTTIKMVEIILSNSRTLKSLYKSMDEVEKLDGRLIEQLTRQIAIRKLIPTKGMLFTSLQTCISRIIGKKVLLKKIDRLRGTNCDPKNSSHLKLLKKLWIALKGPSDMMVPPIPDERWKELGFQGTNPATDFRGAGMYGLHQLLFFAENYQNGRRIYQEAQYGPYWYSFAVVALNATSAIVNYLKAGQFDMILYEGVPDLEMLDRLYAVLLEKFHHIWMDAKPANLFAFNEIFAKAQIFLLQFK